MRQNGHPLIKALLFPFSMLYGVVVLIRNTCFNFGIFISRDFGFPIISVGNITVGGTGKTPHVEYIVSLLREEFRVGVLSRGYRRKSCGFVIASTASEVRDVGDEPLQIKRKFPDVEVAVDADRVRGIRKLCSYNHGLQAMILDDAFQHRRVKAGISILLVDYNQPLKNDLLLPAGRLREYVSAKNRAVIVIVSKCPPGIKPIERRILMKDLNLYPWQSLLFSTFSYGEPLPVFDDSVPFPGREKLREEKTRILMITGIVSPRPLKKHLRGITPKIKHMAFPDHHQYTKRDAARIREAWESLGEQRKVMMTSEKDAMRFRQTGDDIDPEIRKNMYYIPVTVSFIEKDGEAFNNQILHYVRNNKRDHIIC